MNQIKYITANVTLDKGQPTAEVNTEDLPDGIVTHIALVKDTNTSEIVNLEVLQNNSRVLHPMDIRFSEQKSTGNFLDGLRPVSGMRGGRKYQVRLSALKSTRTDDLTVQVLFVIQPEF